MTQDEIIEMAKEAGLTHIEMFGAKKFIEVWLPDLERFAKLVAAKERNRCCLIIYGQCGSDNVAERTVKAIRARGSEA